MVIQPNKKNLNDSLTKKMYLSIFIVLLFAFLQIFVVYIALHFVGGMRGYIIGESLWSKAQKNAIISLNDYADTGNELKYNNFLKFIEIPLADKNARIELNKTISNHKVVYDEFLRGGNDSNNIYKMIDLYYYFNKVSYIKEAIRIWAEADKYFNQLISLSNKIKNKIDEGEKDLTDEITTLHQINDNLSQLEINFSNVLNEGSIWLESTIIRSLILFFLLTSILSLSLATHIIFFLRKKIEDFIKIVKTTSNSDFTTRIEITSENEFSSLAKHFNEMLESIEAGNKKNIMISKELRESEEKFHQAFDYAAIGMAIVSLDGYWIKVNKSMSNIVGYNEEELRNLTFQDITYADDLETDLQYVQRLLEGEILNYQMEKRYIRKNQTIIWILLSASLVRDNTTQEPLYFLAQIQDIDKQKKATLELEQLAYLDNISLAHNRQSLVKEFHLYKNSDASPNAAFNLCYVGIKNSQHIESQFGNKNYISTLKIITSRLKTLFENSSIISRTTNAEFVILFQTSSDDSLNALKNKIYEALQTPINVNDNFISIEVSVGFSSYPGDDLELEELIKIATVNANQ